MKHLSILSGSIIFDQISPDVSAFNARHSKQKIFNQKCFLDLYGECAELLGPLFGQMDLELPPVLLMLLDEWLVLVGNTIVIQKWSFVKPVWQMRDRRLYDLVCAVVADVLAICAKDKILLNLTVLAERRL